MTDLLQLADARRRRRIVAFDRRELGRLLDLYSRRVAAGEWRDYAIDFRPGMAIFSVFRHTAEQPLYAIAKTAANGQRSGDYMVISGRQKLGQGRTIEDVLDVLERQLRVVSKRN